jgi:hypothetical protein
VSPPQKKLIQAQSAGRGYAEQGSVISSSIAGMCIQFRIIIFYSRSEEQQKEYLHLKKYTTSLPAAIVIIDKSDRHINFNSLKKFVTSLSATIGALTSCLGPIQKVI